MENSLMTDMGKIIELKPTRLTKEAFEQFGDVISHEGDAGDVMNGSTFDRFLDLAEVDVGDKVSNRVQVNIVECKEPEQYPYFLTLMEKHPYSSQMFYPLFDHEYLVAVAPPGSEVIQSEIQLFVASATQGVNYRKGTWHMPMLGISKGDRFLMVERNRMQTNCELHKFNDYRLRVDLPLSIKGMVQESHFGGDQ